MYIIVPLLDEAFKGCPASAGEASCCGSERSWGGRIDEELFCS